MPHVRKILIIDDDEDDRLLFMDAVKEVDSSSLCVDCPGGVEALDWLASAEELPDLIFLDLNMPRLDGKELLSRIINDDHLKKIPVIIYSTSRRREDIEEMMAIGAVHFLTKPVLFNDICAALRQVLNKKWLS